MKSCDLMIFDCDGTLVDSEAFNNNVTSDLLLGLGLPEYTRETCFRLFMGMSWNEIKPMLIEKHGDVIPGNIVEMYIKEVYDGIPEHVQPVKGVHDMLAKVSQTHKICIGSNGERPNVIREIEATGLLDFFEERHIFTKSQVKNAKPAPDLFLYAAREMGATPERTMVVEDSPTGVRAGVAAGMHVVGFCGSAHDPEVSAENLRAAGADDIINDLIHIPEMLKT